MLAPGRAQRCRASLRRLSGFSVIELMLVLGVGAVIVAGSYYAYGVVSRDQASRANADATVNLIAAIKHKWSYIGAYTGVSGTSVINAGLVKAPFTYSGTTIYSGYGMTVWPMGSADEMQLMIYIPKSECLATVSALDRIAYKIIHMTGTIKDESLATPKLLSSWNLSCGPDLGGKYLLQAIVK